MKLLFKEVLYCAVMLGCFNSFAAQTEPLHYQVIDKDQHQIHLLEVDRRYNNVISVMADKEPLQKQEVSSFVKQDDAIAGINAGFFHLDKEGKAKAAGALKIDNKWIGYAHLPRAAIGWNKNNNKVLVDRIITIQKKRGDKQLIEVMPQIDKSPASVKAWQQFDYIVGGIPLLIKNSKVIENHSPEKTSLSFLNDRHARTAICIKDDNHWLLLVASHTKQPYRSYTQEIVEGLTIAELTQVLQNLGCQQAINLDGGGSSTLVFEQTIKNSPAGDMDDIFHVFHERLVHDALLVVKAEKSS